MTVLSITITHILFFYITTVVCYCLLRHQIECYQFQCNFLCHCQSHNFLIHHPLKYPQQHLRRFVQLIQYHLLLSTRFHRFLVHWLWDLEHFSQFAVHRHTYILCFHIAQIYMLEPVEKCNKVATVLHLAAEWQLKIFHFFSNTFKQYNFPLRKKLENSHYQ